MKKLYRDWRIYAIIALIAISYLIYSCSRPTDIETEQEKEISVHSGVIYQLITEGGRPPGLLTETDHFDSWSRYPMEGGGWVGMIDSTAYFRDSLVAGTTFLVAENNGDTWSTYALRPDGSTGEWWDVVFYEVYGDDEDCFVSFSWRVCDTRYLYVKWWTTATCRPTGTWTMVFSKNGEPFHAGNFELLPSLPPGTVKTGSAYSQNTYSSVHYDCRCYYAHVPKDTFTTCDSIYTEEASIARLGCFLTGVSLILDYHGVTMIPPDLNAYLSQNSCSLGYKKGNVSADAAALLVPDLSYDGIKDYDPDLLRYALCSSGPQMLFVHRETNTDTACHHFVVATGIDEQNDTYMIVDPKDGTQKLLNSEYDKICGMRIFDAGLAATFDQSSIWIIFMSPGELLVTDPEGRRTGLDPITGISYKEIPEACYQEEFIGTDDFGGGMHSKQFYLSEPIDGDYTITVTGTGEGTYDISINTYDIESSPSTLGFDDLSIYTDAIHKYKINYSKTAGTTSTLEGGYDGDSQRKWDVNQLLSYFTVADKVLQLPSGVTHLDLGIVYHEDIDPGSFTATLNDDDISDLFNPAPGTYELVRLDLSMGSNKLLLSIEGDVPAKKNIDNDKFDITVKP